MNDKFVGFRFRPTDEEILAYFLEKKMGGHDFPVHAIDEIDLLKYNPSQLPQMSVLPDDQVWYFFSAPSCKYSNSKRTDRTTSEGSWKKTGKDRYIRDKYSKEVIGVKKTLVFYKGRSPNAERTNWVIHEFHSNNAPRYPKEFVLCRVKRKYDDKYDASHDEPIQFWPSNSRTLQDEPSNFIFPSNSGTPAANFNFFTQVNHQPPVELEPPEFDIDYDELESLMQEDQGHYHANGSSREHNLFGPQLHMSDHEDDFVNSLLADDVDIYDQNVHARAQGVNPTKPLTGQMFAGDSDGFNPTNPFRKIFVEDLSESDLDFATEESGHVLRTPSLFNVNVGLKKSQQRQTVHSPTITRWSSNRENINGVYDFNHYDVLQTGDSDTDMSDDLVLDEFPSTTRTCRSQHLPKSHNFVEKTCAPVELQFRVLDESPIGTRLYKSQHPPKSHSLKKEPAPKRVQFQDIVATDATSRNKGKDAKQAIGLSRKESCIAKLGNDQKMVPTTHTKTNLELKSTASDSNNGKISSISSVTSPLSNKHNSPLEYLGNVVIGVILLVILLCELASLH